MNHRWAAFVGFLWLACVTGGAAQRAPRAAVPEDPVDAIVAAFRTHSIVALSDPHGNVQVQAFLLSLIRDPRFAAVVDDVVIETANARHQDAIDRFVRGEDVDETALRKAWEDHTVPNSFGTQAAEFIRAVRAVNASLGGSRQLRVLAGDPPIDWDNVARPQDHARWVELRDSHPADLIRRRVLDRGRRALVIYGQGHLQRRQMLANYDMSSWQAQTVVSLLERDDGRRAFNIWTWLDRDAPLPAEVMSWRVPSLAQLGGTSLGEWDFALYQGGGARFGVKADRLVPIPREEWKTMRMEEQFEAVLYLGPPASMTMTGVPAVLCADRDFVRRRLDRLMRFSPRVEVESLRAACGLTDAP